eukprot:GHUV01050628.1.p2 GENE.GHUV01050628.1~~GHUV01050628.1.p2  ORF type:complete len:131 (-),score=29.29 GHUV01050628.1:92-484(-)
MATIIVAIVESPVGVAVTARQGLGRLAVVPGVCCIGHRCMKDSTADLSSQQGDEVCKKKVPLLLASILCCNGLGQQVLLSKHTLPQLQKSPKAQLTSWISAAVRFIHTPSAIRVICGVDACAVDPYLASS